MMNMYIEFNGVAGSGKTTICNCFIEKLEEDGFSTRNYHDLYKEYVRTDGWKKRFVRDLTGDPEGRKAIGLTLRGIFEAGLFNVQLRYVPYFILTYYLILRFSDRNSGTVLVSDEGLIQSIISLLYDNRLRTPRRYASLANLTNHLSTKTDFICVNVNLEEERIKERLRHRKNGESRLDQEADASLRELIQTQKHNFSIVRGFVDANRQIDIDSSKPAIENASYIRDQIKKRAN